MDLVHINEPNSAYGIFDNSEICNHMSGKVSHIVAGVETIIWGRTHSSMPGKYGMRQLRISGKKGVAETGNWLLNPYKAGSLRHDVH